MEQFFHFTDTTVTAPEKKMYKNMSKAALALLLAGILFTSTFQMVKSIEQSQQNQERTDRPPKSLRTSLTVNETVEKYDLAPKDKVTDFLLACSDFAKNHAESKLTTEGFCKFRCRVAKHNESITYELCFDKAGYVAKVDQIVML